MLKFDRPNFRSGVCIVKEPILIEEEGKEPIQAIKMYKFYYRDLGKTFEFHNEDYVLAKYPVLFKRVD